MPTVSSSGVRSSGRSSSPSPTGSTQPPSGSRSSPVTARAAYAGNSPMRPGVEDRRDRKRRRDAMTRAFPRLLDRQFRRPVVTTQLTLAAVLLLCLSLTSCGGDPKVSQGTPDNPGGLVVSGGDSGPYAGAEPAKPYQMPDVTLTATNDQDFNLRKDTGYPVTLFFFG